MCIFKYGTKYRPQKKRNTEAILSNELRKSPLKNLPVVRESKIGLYETDDVEILENNVSRTKQNVKKNCFSRFMKKLCAACSCKKSPKAVIEAQDNKAINAKNTLIKIHQKRYSADLETESVQRNEEGKKFKLNVQRTQDDISGGDSDAAGQSEFDTCLGRNDDIDRVEKTQNMEDILLNSQKSQITAASNIWSDEPLSYEPLRMYARREIKDERADAHDPLYATLISFDESSFETVDMQSARTHSKNKNRPIKKSQNDSKLSDQTNSTEGRKSEEFVRKNKISRLKSAEKTQD